MRSWLYFVIYPYFLSFYLPPYLKLPFISVFILHPHFQTPSPSPTPPSFHPPPPSISVFISIYIESKMILIMYCSFFLIVPHLLLSLDNSVLTRNVYILNNKQNAEKSIVQLQHKSIFTQRLAYPRPELWIRIRSHLHNFAVPEFIDPVFTKTSPKRSFSLNRKRAFWLVFAKPGSIISGTGSGGFGSVSIPSKCIFHFISIYQCCGVANISLGSASCRSELRLRLHTNIFATLDFFLVTDIVDWHCCECTVSKKIYIFQHVCKTWIG